MVPICELRINKLNSVNDYFNHANSNHVYKVYVGI